MDLWGGFWGRISWRILGADFVVDFWGGFFVTLSHCPGTSISEGGGFSWRILWGLDSIVNNDVFV